MVSWRRLLFVGFGLCLSVGAGLQALTLGFMEGPRVNPDVPVFVGAAGSFAVGYILLERVPALQTDDVWRFGLVTFGLFTVGNLLAPNGFNAPVEDVSLFTVVVPWLVAASVAYAIVFEKGLSWLKNRVTGSDTYKERRRQ